MRNFSATTSTYVGPLRKRRLAREVPRSPAVLASLHEGRTQLQH